MWVKKRLFEVSVVCFILNLILSIIYGYVSFLFLVLLLFLFVLIIQKKKNPKTFEIFKQTKIFYFVSYFIFLEVYYMNSNISFNLEHT